MTELIGRKRWAIAEGYIQKLVVGEMPWTEPPTRTGRRAKLGPPAAEVDKLYGSRSPSVHERSARGAS